MTSLIREILAVEVDDDGVTYDISGMTAVTIREQDPYVGVRAKVPAQLHRAAQTLRIDINVGDPVTPAPVDIAYPALLDQPFTILGYPIETLLAEKIVTMVDRGTRRLGSVTSPTSSCSPGDMKWRLSPCGTPSKPRRAIEAQTSDPSERCW